MNKLSLYTAVLCCLAAPIPCTAYASQSGPADVQQAEQTELKDLHEAIRKGDDATAIQIIRRCANPNAMIDYTIAIELAAEFGRVEVIRELQAHNSYKSHKANYIDACAQAYFQALEKGQREAAKLLYNPAWRNPYTGGGSTMLAATIFEGDDEMALWIIDNGGPIQEPDEALLCAVEHNSALVLTRLLEKGVNPNVRDGYDSTTPLHWAVMRRGRTEMVRILLEFDADPDIMPSKNRIDRTTLADDETPYKTAQRFGRTEAAKMMEAAREKRQQKR